MNELTNRCADDRHFGFAFLLSRSFSPLRAGLYFSATVAGRKAIFVNVLSLSLTSAPDPLLRFPIGTPEAQLHKMRLTF